MTVQVTRHEPTEQPPVKEVNLVNPIIPAFTCTVKGWRRNKLSGGRGLYINAVKKGIERVGWDMVIQGEEDVNAFIQALIDLARADGVTVTVK